MGLGVGVAVVVVVVVVVLLLVCVLRKRRRRRRTEDGRGRGRGSWGGEEGVVLESKVEVVVGEEEVWDMDVGMGRKGMSLPRRVW